MDIFVSLQNCIGSSCSQKEEDYWSYTMTIALTVLGSLCSDFITVDNFMLLTVCNVWKHLILQHLKCR